MRRTYTGTCGSPNAIPTQQMYDHRNTYQNTLTTILSNMVPERVGTITT